MHGGLRMVHRFETVKGSMNIHTVTILIDICGQISMHTPARHNREGEQTDSWRHCITISGIVEIANDRLGVVPPRTSREEPLWPTYSGLVEM